MDIWDYVNEFDIDELKKQTQSAQCFPHFCIDNFLKDKFAEEVYLAFPNREYAKEIGKEFKGVSELGKIQITDSNLFPTDIKVLNDLLAHESLLEILRYVFEIPNLKADELLVGGGIHQTNSGGRLDVHVDFNYIEKRNLHRRLNLLLYFNKDWKESYGGYLDLWDESVKHRIGYFEPKFNRLCAFETNEISYHGVTPLNCPDGVLRQSFATYYYTNEPPNHWMGVKHSTIFKPRPSEFIRGNILFPYHDLVKKFKHASSGIKYRVKGLFKAN